MVEASILYKSEKTSGHTIWPITIKIVALFYLSWLPSENEYFERDGLVEDLIEYFVIECGSDSDDEELVDNDDRQLIDNTLRSTTTSTICTNPRHDLTDTMQITIFLWLY